MSDKDVFLCVRFQDFRMLIKLTLEVSARTRIGKTPLLTCAGLAGAFAGATGGLLTFCCLLHSSLSPSPIFFSCIDNGDRLYSLSPECPDLPP